MSILLEEEDHLVGLARAGNESAFLELTRHYIPLIHRQAFAVTLDEREAFDLAVEAVRRARDGISRIPSGKRFLPWILRLVRNLAVTRARRRGAGSVAGRSSGTELADLFRRLGPDEQMAIALRVDEQLSYREIAELLDQPLHLLLVRLAAARSALLSQDGGQSDGGGGIHMTPQQLSAYIDRELPQASSAIVERHLSVCETCSQTYRRLEEQTEALADLLQKRANDRALVAAAPEASAGEIECKRSVPEAPSVAKRRPTHAAWWVVAGVAALAGSVAIVTMERRGVPGWTAPPPSTSTSRGGQLPAGIPSGRRLDDPRWLEDAETAAQRAEALADESASADRLDAAAETWEVVLPQLLESPEDGRIARRELAHVRFRAWEIAPTPQRATAAESALRDFLFDEPAGPDRSDALAHLARLGR